MSVFLPGALRNGTGIAGTHTHLGRTGARKRWDSRRRYTMVRRNARCALAMSEIPSECAVQEQSRSKSRKKKKNTARLGKWKLETGRKLVGRGCASVNERGRILRSVTPNEVRGLWRGRRGAAVVCGPPGTLPLSFCPALRLVGAKNATRASTAPSRHSPAE